MKKHYQLMIKGKVQGVWYRVSTLKKAQELNLKGFVCNQKDGSVYIEAEGEAAALDTLVEWCKIGPTFARVENVDKSEKELKNFSEFYIKR